jgi:hypothetical protein
MSDYSIHPWWKDTDKENTDVLQDECVPEPFLPPRIEKSKLGHEKKNPFSNRSHPFSIT